MLKINILNLAVIFSYFVVTVTVILYHLFTTTLFVLIALNTYSLIAEVISS